MLHLFFVFVLIACVLSCAQKQCLLLRIDRENTPFMQMFIKLLKKTHFKGHLKDLH